MSPLTTKPCLNEPLEQSVQRESRLSRSLSAVLFGMCALAASQTVSANTAVSGSKTQAQGYHDFGMPDLSSSSLFSTRSAQASAFDSSDFTLPDLGSGGGRFVEQNQHKAVGEWSLQQLGKSAPMLNDPWSQEQLESMAWRINAQARTQAPLALMVVNNASINAFAIPGGVMGLHTGTVIESNSMDEVASVVAHEVAHLSQRHYEHRGDASTKALMLQIGGLLAAMAATAASGDAAAAIMMGSQTAALNSQMAFSRSNEREADRIGMQLMAKSGYDPRAMPRFFATLNQQSQLNMSKQAYLPSFVMTHPLSSERLSEAQSRAKSYDSAGISSQNEQLTFDLLKWRLMVLTKRVSEGDLAAAAKRSQGASLALAYWYGSQGRYSAAASELNKLKKLPEPKSYADKVSFDILMAITEAEIAGMRGKWQEAETILQPYYNVYPERRDLKILLADAWLQLGKYNQVITAMKPLVQSRPHDVEALFRMQRAYELMAQAPETTSNNRGLAHIATVNALRYRAQGELWQGKYDDALISLKQAKTLLEDKNSKSASRFSTAQLLATVKKDIEDVKTAKDFRP